MNRFILPTAFRPWLCFATDPAASSGGTEPPTPDPSDPAGGDDPGSDPATADGDEVLGEPGKRALAAERAARKAAERQATALADQVKAFEDAQKTEKERLADQLADAEKRATAAERAALVARLGRELPDELQPFLTGSTEAEISAQVETLKAATANNQPGGHRPPAPDPSQGAKPEPDAAKALDDEIAEAIKRGDYAASTRLKRHKAALAANT